MRVYWLTQDLTEIESIERNVTTINRNGINKSAGSDGFTEAEIIEAGGGVEPDRPVIDTLTHRLGDVIVVGGVLSWDVIAYTAEEIEANYQATIPTVVTMRQARVYLNGLGILSAITSQIEAMGGDALITWEYSQEVQRENPLIATMAAALGWSETDLDTMFIDASKL